jgi:hypothetical protein
MESYAQHRITDWEWIPAYKERYGEGAYYDYVHKVCNAMKALKPGYCCDLTAPGNRELMNVSYTTPSGEKKARPDISFCIKACCLWLLDNQDYVFNDNYTKIKRYRYA